MARGRCAIRSRHIAAAAATLLALVGSAGLLGITAAPAAAAAGTWGAEAYPYSNGLLCTAPSSDGNPADTNSIPLVSWNLGPGLSPAFLIGDVSSSAGVDSTVPPFTAQGATSSPLPSGSGIDSATAQATTAYLISTWGASADPVRVAEVSDLVAAETGSTTASSCLAAGQGGLSSSQAAAMWSQAQAYAGPYHVSLTSSAGPTNQAVLGQPVPVRAIVTSAVGQPVAGLAVSFAASGASIAQASVSTAADGSASTTVTMPPTATLTDLTVTATVSAVTTLELVSNPVATTGGGSAVALGSPTPTTASAQIAINQQADPVLTSGASPALDTIGTPVQVTGGITGLNGHSATGTISVAGPLAPGAGGCAALTTAQWASAVGANSALVQGTVEVSTSGDGPLNGPSFTPHAAGCYATSATASTTNAVPNVTRNSNYRSSLTVLSTTVAAALGHNGISSTGTPAASVTVAGLGSATASVRATLLGPLAPVANSCATVAWSKAADAGSVPTLAISADGVYKLVAPPVTLPGCYAIGLSSTISLSGVGSATLTTAGGSTGTSALVLDPGVQVIASTDSVNTSQPMRASAQVTGSLTQPGTLTTSLLWTPPQLLGCRAAPWAQAEHLAASSATSVTGDGSYPVSSPAPSRPGCYSMVVTFALAADPQLSATSTPGSTSSIFLATARPTVQLLGSASHSTRPPIPAWGVAAGVGLLFVIAAGVTVGLAWRSRTPARPAL